MSFIAFKIFLLSAIFYQLCTPFVCNLQSNQGVSCLHLLRRQSDTGSSRLVLNDVNQHPELSTLRSATVKSIMSNVMAAMAALAVVPTVANARQGAFEMDVEYYLKTVASRAQGKPDATIDAKTAKPAFASARVVNKDLATGVMAIVIEEISRISKVSIPDVTTKVNAQLALYLPYFKEFVPIRSETLADQYYFDITLYASYLIAAQLIPKSTDRVILRKAVGDSILDLFIEKKMISAPAGYSKEKSLPLPDNLKLSAGAINDFCTSFTISITVNNKYLLYLAHYDDF